MVSDEPVAPALDYYEAETRRPWHGLAFLERIKLVEANGHGGRVTKRDQLPFANCDFVTAVGEP